MGLKLMCEYTKRRLDFGYFGSGFNCLQRKIAKLAGEPFFSHYSKLFDLMSNPNPEILLSYDFETERLIRSGKVSPHVVDFCLQPDCGGFVTWRACRKLLQIIDGYDNVVVSYYAVSSTITLGDVGQILKDCVKHKCSMRWR